MLIRSASPINADFFSGPEHARQIAFAGKGMLNPSREVVSPFTNYRMYRLGHSHLSDEENLSSPWWNDYESFVTLKRFAETNSISLTMSSRVQNAQAPDFGPADVLYIAELAAPLFVFRGLGRPIHSADGRVYFPPNAITQTFIPGLRSWPNKTLSAIGHRAFGEFKREVVQKGLISLYGE